MLMFALPEIIKKDQVSIILPFFSRDQQDDQQEQVQNEDEEGLEDSKKLDEDCNMEVFITDPALPLKSDQEVESFSFSYFKDVNCYLREVIDRIVENDKSKNDAERNISVEHSLIDF